MKKLTKILVPFLVLSSAVLSGCKKKVEEDNRTRLSFGDVHLTETVEVTVSELNEIKKEKDTNNFLLVVNSNTCTCWNEFKPNLDKYISLNHVFCYRIDYLSIKDVASGFNLNNLTKSSTTFAIFENGELKTSICTDSDSKIMYDENRFSQYMSESVILPSCYFITKDDFHTIKNSGKNAVIYFERAECGDCKAINPGILNSYFKKRENTNKVYIVDLQPYYGTAEYQDIKDELGLSESGNPSFGFGTGVVPFFSYIENSTYASGAVVYNDSVNSDLVVSKSYYSAERVANLEYTSTVVQGMQLTENDVNKGTYQGFEFVSWDHSSADKVYEGILNSFLDYALPKVTFSF